MAEVLEYQDAKEEYLGHMVDGKLKITDKAITFRNSRTGKSQTIAGSEIEEVHWIRIGAGFGIRLLLENGSFFRFGGLKETDLDSIKTYFKTNYDKELDTTGYSTRGWNWGEAEFTGSVLPFKVRDKIVFDVPLNYVSSTTYNKNEVTLAFHQNDDAPISLMEMRFHIPTREGSDDNVKSFHDNVLAKASVLQVVGDAIVTFQDVFCLQPSRGRYEFKFYPSFLHLHGKTYDFKIPYPTIIRIFMLPDPKLKLYYLVVSLDPPVKHGQTRYHFLIMSFERDEETTVELHISDEDLEKKYDNKLDKEMSGTECVIFAKLLKILSGRKVISSDSSTFQSQRKYECISGNYKAQSGLIYPLDRGFVYVGKPPLHIRFDEISYVNFARSSTATKSFDFDIDTKNGVVHTFSSIPKDEYNVLFDYMKLKKVRIKNRGFTSEVPTDSLNLGSESEEEGNLDPYMAKVKREAEMGGSDEDSEDDEDFLPEKEEVSDVADEYDSNVSSTTSDDEDASSGSGGSEAEQRRKERKEMKQKEKEKKKKKKTVKEFPEGRTKKSKRKSKRDPDAPKRPATAYFLFLNDKREQINRDNPGISITDVSREAGKMWKELDQKQKYIYETKVVEAKKKYEEDMKAYLASKGSDVSSRPSKSISPSKGGSGAHFKSKEFIEDSESESSEDDDEKPLKNLKEEKKKKKKKHSGSEEEQSSPEKKKRKKKKHSGSEEDRSPEKQKKKKKNDSASEESEEEQAASTPPSSDVEEDPGSD